MIADIPKKMELKFWNVVIPAMSKNTRLQKCIQVAYEVASDKDLRTRTLMILVGSLSGFLAGLMLFTYAF